MTTENSNKITIRYKEKDYEIEKKKDEQKIKPKGSKNTDKEIVVKDYEEGGFLTSHKCKCSENGSNFEVIDIKWGAKKHITIWGSSSILLLLLGLGAWWYLKKEPQDKEKEEI